MKKYHLNKKEINFWFKKACKELSLPKINIIIEKVLEAKILNSSPCYNPDKNYIKIPQILNFLIVDRGYRNEGIKLNDSKEWCIFVIFHEVAHYFQFYYYQRWFNKFTTRKHYFNFGKVHCLKKVERNADKIALILFKKLYEK